MNAIPVLTIDDVATLVFPIQEDGFQLLGGPRRGHDRQIASGEMIDPIQRSRSGHRAAALTVKLQTRQVLRHTGGLRQIDG